MVRYTVRCKNDDSLIYVGSTIQPLFKRWFQHKQNLNNEKFNMLLYQKMRETERKKMRETYIELYEDCSCENKEQLNRREGEIIREIATINRNIVGRKKKEYMKEYDFYNTYVCMYVCMYVYMYVCMYVCMYVYIPVCIYMCIHIYIHK